MSGTYRSSAHLILEQLPQLDLTSPIRHKPIELIRKRMQGDPITDEMGRAEEEVEFPWGCSLGDDEERESGGREETGTVEVRVDEVCETNERRKRGVSGWTGGIREVGGGVGTDLGL